MQSIKRAYLFKIDYHNPTTWHDSCLHIVATTAILEDQTTQHFMTTKQTVMALVDKYGTALHNAYEGKETLLQAQTDYTFGLITMGCLNMRQLEFKEKNDTCKTIYKKIEEALN